MAARKRKARAKASKRQPKAAKRGRPSFRATKPLRERVQQWRSVGMSEEEIAMALDVSRPTLRKHFKLELKKGHAVKKARAFSLLWDNAEAGNVSAQRKLVDLTKVLPDTPTRAERDADPAAPPKLKVLLQGKKAQAKDDAQTAEVGTPWEGLLDVDPKSATKN